MSVIRVGSTGSYAEGWEAIFGGKAGARKKSAAATARGTKSSRKKPSRRKSSGKKKSPDKKSVTPKAASGKPAAKKRAGR